MGKVKINGLDVWVLSGNQAEADTKTATNINKALELLKALVGVHDFLDEKFGATLHGLVEYLIEPHIFPAVFKCMHPVYPFEGYPSFQNCPF